MKTSVNILRRELAEIQQAHGQLKNGSFVWGDLEFAMSGDSKQYPLTCAYFPTANILNNQTSIPLTIVVCDLVYKDQSNLEQVESDLMQVCRDLFNILNRSKRWNNLARVDSCSASKFKAPHSSDEVAGYAITFQLIVRDSNSICDIPVFNYDFDAVYGSTCSPVHIYNSIELIESVPSGTDYVIPDTTLNFNLDFETATATFATLSNQTINITLV